MPDLDVMWHAADPALPRCLELAHQSFLAGGLPVGSVIVARGGELVSAGRNRAYDPAGGPDRLQRTPIAHAEMNALAGVDIFAGLAEMTLWSSHQPCAMCAAACAFTGVGTVWFIAPDPSSSELGADPDVIETEWVVVANLLFLSGVAAYSGASSAMVVRAGRREPEITGLMREVGDAGLRQPVLRDALALAWPLIQGAAAERRVRLARDVTECE